LVFAREVSDSLAGLAKKLDAEVAKHGKRKMAAAIVVLSSDSSVEAKIKEMKEAQGLTNVSLALETSEAGPRGYNINKDADVTVLLYNKHKVEVNHAYKKGEFNDKAVATVVSDLPRIVK
jgi:hypothetical protein